MRRSWPRKEQKAFDIFVKIILDNIEKKGDNDYIIQDKIKIKFRESISEEIRKNHSEIYKEKYFEENFEEYFEKFWNELKHGEVIKKGKIESLMGCDIWFVNTYHLGLYKLTN